MEIAIINAVKTHPIIYDREHEDYCKHKKRHETYDAIAQDLNLKSGDEVKNTWQRIRRNYSRYLQKEDKKKNYKYSQEMEFFKDYIGNINVRREQLDVPEENDLSDFFIEMYQETKELPAVLQEHVKEGIKKIIAEAKEMQANASSPVQQNAQETDRDSNGTTSQENEGRESPPRALIDYINNFIP